MPARGTRPGSGAGSPCPPGWRRKPARIRAGRAVAPTRLPIPAEPCPGGSGEVTSAVPSGPRGRGGAVSESRLGLLWFPGPRWGRPRGPWRCAEPPLPALPLAAPAEDGCTGSRGQVVSVSGDELSRGTLGAAVEPRGRCMPVLSARSVPVGWDLFPISRLLVGFAGQQEGACSQEPGSGRWAWWDSQPPSALVLRRCSVPGTALEVLLLLFFLSILPLPPFLLVQPQLVAGIAQRWSGGCEQGTWCHRLSAVGSERCAGVGR